MRVVILKDDNAVSVDGERFAVGCTDLPVNFHALQWDGVRGEIEYSLVVCDHCGVRSKKLNEFISDMAPYQKYVDAWQAAKTAAAVEAARVAAEKVKSDAPGPQG